LSFVENLYSFYDDGFYKKMKEGQNKHEDFNADKNVLEIRDNNNSFSICIYLSYFFIFLFHFFLCVEDDVDDNPDGDEDFCFLLSFLYIFFNSSR
jgi:hypothetical protein